MIAFSFSVHAGAGITLWHNLSHEVIKTFAKRFTQQSGIPVDTVWFRGPEYTPALLDEAQHDGLPDVALVPGDLLALDNELGFSEIPVHLQSPNILKNAAAAGVHARRVLGVPISWGNHLMLYYNRDYVKKPAATFDELEKQAAGFKAKGIHPLAMHFREMYWFVPFMSAFGGWPLDEQGKLNLDQPSTSHALAFYFELLEKGLTLKECDNTCTLDRFADGEFAYSIGGDWMYRELSEKLGPKLGVALLPAIGKQPLTPMCSAYLLVFPRKSLDGKRHKQLEQFIRFMQSPETQQAVMTEAGLFPVNKRVFDRVRANANENIRASMLQLNRARPMPNDRSMKHAWIGMSKGFSALYAGKASAPQAAVLMQRHAIKAKRYAD